VVSFLLPRIFADRADVPWCNAKGFKAWLTELEGFCQVANDWAMVRAGVFNELSTTVEHRNDFAGVLNLARGLVKERGAKEFQRILPGLFLHNKDSKAKEVENV
jgi:hypothetical protein